jgi:hypothetical protein
LIKKTSKKNNRFTVQTTILSLMNLKVGTIVTPNSAASEAKYSKSACMNLMSGYTVLNLLKIGFASLEFVMMIAGQG